MRVKELIKKAAVVSTAVALSVTGIVPDVQTTAAKAATAASAAKTTTTTSKSVIAASFKNNTFSYYKSANSTRLIPNVKWENIVGTGKKKTLKVAANAEYRLLDTYTVSKTYKVTKKKFMKTVKAKFGGKATENKVSYYSGMACKITVKQGKITKIVQIYQP